MISGILHKFVLMSHDPLRAWISSFNVGEAIAITNSPSPSPLASVDQPTQEHKLEMAQVEAKVVVPESVLKKRKREAEWALAKKQELEAAKKKSAKNRKLIFNRAKQYSKEYEQKENEVIQLKREAKLKGGFYVEPEVKLLFIVRIRGINAMDLKTRKILQLLRLR
ncbi:hypothetical protein LWI29_004930 [Acer saccharum]|uniref:Ribosomal protein L30 N-terminal domain-containing protein n=1 Tax=Acer saccharum TaxID=4024 RepID=A0AA39RNF4_ACESA|nr:hypothetical protein LWI29_004930 [Acer saccharum]